VDGYQRDLSQCQRDIPRNDHIISTGYTSPSPEVNNLSRIYPALLSHVALSFRQGIKLSSHTKDSLEYKECFVGKDAVVRANASFFKSCLKLQSFGNVFKTMKLT